MFDYTSRYYALETAVYTTPDGRQQPYARRRFLPNGANLQLLAQVSVTQNDRLDLIAARTLGVAQQYWQICDANNAMNPFDLVSADQVGAVVRIPMPQVPQS